MMKPLTPLLARTLPLALPLAFLAAPAPLWAQSTAPATPGTDIVVTALRTPVDHDRVASSITVLDLADIQAAQPLALTDLLARTPGIGVARNGGYGGVTTLRIRGANPEDTVMVIDGMRMANATAIAGGFDFTQLFTDDIARVEVLRGPQAILWGSDALGGIINVSTQAPSAPLQGDFSAEIGSHATLSTHMGLGGTSALVDWRIAGADFTTAGIPALAGGTTANGYDRQAASATTRFHLASNLSLDLRGFWDAARNSFSDTYSLYPSTGVYAGDYALAKQWSAYAGLNLALLNGHFRTRASVQQNQTDNEDYYPVFASGPSDVYHGRIRRYEYQGDVTLTRGVGLVFGAERAEARMVEAESLPYDLTPHSASTDSLYAEARVSPFTGLTLNGGARYDHHSRFGGNTVASAGAAYTPDGGASLLRFSYDEGFKAPSLYQLFSTYGTANLLPEHAKGWEVGAERALFGQALHLAATWFTRSSSNLITFAYCPASGPLPAACTVPGTMQPRFGYYANLGAAQAHGLELSGKARRGHVFAEGNYSLLVAEDRTPGSATYGQQLPRVPRHLANAEVGYDWAAVRGLGGLTTSVALRTSGANLSDVYSMTELPGYVLADMRATWQLPSGLTLFGRVENIADKHYQTAAGYNSLGRVAYVGLRGRF